MAKATEKKAEEPKVEDTKIEVKEKQLDISEVKQAKENISDLKVYGDGDTFRLLCKASSQQEGWMKSTKVCNVGNGCIVQVTTQQRNQDGSYAVAEAVTYVPNTNINVDVEPRRLEPFMVSKEGHITITQERYKELEGYKKICEGAKKS